MNVFVNDARYETQNNVDLKSFLHSLELEDFSGWAIALNEEVISATDFDQMVLKNDDRLLLIQATQGG
ncbi:MAG: sulfur carrier protein ThiS [Opitutales bacterium]|nr:sulfur carrier protein ThiS [Opitutales bacterium]